MTSVSVVTLTGLIETSESHSNGEEGADAENAESIRQPIGKAGTSVIGFFCAIALLLIVNVILLFSDLRCNPSPYAGELSDSDSESDSN
jgi:hypothetical protein